MTGASWNPQRLRYTVYIMKPERGKWTTVSTFRSIFCGVADTVSASWEVGLRRARNDRLCCILDGSLLRERMRNQGG